MTSAAGRRARAVTLASGGVGLVASLAPRQTSCSSRASGIRSSTPEPRPSQRPPRSHTYVQPTGPFRLASAGAWFLASSVLALATAVVLSLGLPAEMPRSPVSSVVGAALLYAGFLAVPVGLAVAAARRRALETALLLALSPFGQALVAAAVVLSR